MKKIIFLNFIFFHYLVFSQEGVRPMSVNMHLLQSFHQKKFFIPSSSFRSSSISLPFYDDFSYASKSAYPNPLLWNDSLVYVNDGMGVAPLNFGVASFDGLNKKGFPYLPNTIFPSNSSAYADTLTSSPINLFTLGSQTLTPADSIALIFYFQKGGNGDNPEIQDSLMVDFYKPKQQKWQQRVWHSKGHSNPNIYDTTFTRAFIFITDTAFFHDGFRFRFRNKAQTNGNFDVWNLDEVYLDKNRSMKADTAWIDLSFGRRTSSFLLRYSAMPWKHLTPSEMAKNFSNYLRYNGTNTVNVTYQLEIRDPNGNILHTQNFGASNLYPFWTGGWQTNTVHSQPALTYTFPLLSDSADFSIKHFVNALAGDTRNNNDTIYMTQSFRNYFAYDDGTCENGFYVYGTGGKAVYFYHLNQTDTLRAVRIHFDPPGNISLNQSYKFRLQIYTSLNGVPYQRIYNDSLKNVQYPQGGHNLFAEYELASPVVLGAGDYFIGYQQFVAAGITVGLDRNYWFPGKLFYDSGNGWTPSAIKGSLMMRPVFGKKPTAVSVKEIHTNSYTAPQIQIYPNPSSDGNFSLLSGTSMPLTFRLYDLTGRLLYEYKIHSSPYSLNLSALSPGVYVFECIKENNIQKGKLIIQ